MKRSIRLADRYANALYLFALENNQLENVYQDVLLLQEVFGQNKDLQLLMGNPILAPEKKSAVFTEIFKDKIGEITFGFLNLILKKKREPAFPYIFEEFVAAYYKHHNIRKANITTAMKLNDALIANIKNVLEEQTRSTIEISETINPDIIGGFIIKIDDYLIDASLRGRINKLKTEFSHNLYQAAF